jgi:hypothetical protein
MSTDCTQELCTGGKPSYVRGRPNGCVIHTSAEDTAARRAAREA